MLPSLTECFKTYRNSLTKILRQAKNAYYFSMFQGITDVKYMWKKLNSFLFFRKPTSNICEMTIGQSVYKGTALANKFNDHFTYSLESTHDTSVIGYLPTPLATTIFLGPTDESEVASTFMKLKNGKSEDIDGIKMEPVAFVFDMLLPSLTHIYNLVLGTGVFPKRMKNAKVVVIHKNGDKNIMNNYRPISVLPIFSKPLEKIIFVRLSKFFDSHSIINASQYGFRPGLSTETALLNQKEFILGNIEEKKLTLGIFVDFTKAFDRINHDTLLLKLSYYGIRGIAYDLIKSYLTDRHQCVCIQRELSSPYKMKCGVPQGSILGPLLFNAYINDIINIDQSAKYIIYADDTSIFFTGVDRNGLIQKANQTLGELHKWSHQNSLLINSTNTKAVLFRAKNKKCEISSKLHLNNVEIQLSQTAKTLGVVFHEYMLWDSQTEAVCCKLSKSLGMLRRCQSLLPTRLKLLLFHTLFASHLHYCQLIWASGTESSKNKIYTLQKNAMRAIGNLCYNAHTSHLFAKFNVLRFNSVYEYRLLMSLKSEIRTNSNTLKSLAHLQLNVSARCNRHSELWHIPTPRTNYGFQMLKFAIPHVLNKYRLTLEQLHSLSASAVFTLLSCGQQPIPPSVVVVHNHGP